MFDQKDNIEGVAVIGMAGIFPKSTDLSDFWKNLCEGKELISFFDDDSLVASGVSQGNLSETNFVKAKAFIEDIFTFDNKLFNYSPREAEYMDPQQRKLLECSWAALEDAGCDPNRYSGMIGSFLCSSINTYFLYHIFPNLLLNKGKIKDESLVILGNEKDFLATKVSYKLNLTGPSKSIQTACSSSLVAVHDACQSILNCECDMAIAGGACITSPQKNGYFFTDEDINSPTGHCLPFDKRARGTVPGNGVGVVVLKNLSQAIEDKDKIYAVIRGAAVNNDGKDKLGYTAPSIVGQRRCIISAIESADIGADEITYIETHGTGTILGDPVEFEALKETFESYTDKKQFCALGAIKSNIGHLDAAAGIAGLIKTVLSLKNKQIPPHANFTEVNPKFNLNDSPFYINTKLLDWNAEVGKLRYAGVSSFGIGGTNAHVILQECPEYSEINCALPAYIFPFSARDVSSLQRLLENFYGFIMSRQGKLDFARMAYTLQMGRVVLPERYFIIAKDIEELSSKLKKLKSINADCLKLEDSKNFLFLSDFSKIGSIRLLYDSLPFFRAILDDCITEAEETLEVDLGEIILTYNGAFLNKLSEFEMILVRFILNYTLVRIFLNFGWNLDGIVYSRKTSLLVASLLGMMTFKEAIVGLSKKETAIKLLESNSEMQTKLFFLDENVANHEKNRMRVLSNDNRSALNDFLEKDVSSVFVYALSNAQHLFSELGVANNKQIHLFNNELSYYKNLLNLIGGIWCRAGDVSWQHLYAEIPQKMSLPHYPFEQKFYCMVRKDLDIDSHDAAKDFNKDQNGDNNLESFIVGLVEEKLRVKDVGLDDSYFALGGDSLTALDLIDEIKLKLYITLPIQTFFEVNSIGGIVGVVRKLLLNNMDSFSDEQIDIITKILH